MFFIFITYLSIDLTLTLQIPVLLVLEAIIPKNVNNTLHVSSEGTLGAQNLEMTWNMMRGSRQRSKISYKKFAAAPKTTTKIWDYRISQTVVSGRRTVGKVISTSAAAISRKWLAKIPYI